MGSRTAWRFGTYASLLGVLIFGCCVGAVISVVFLIRELRDDSGVVFVPAMWLLISCSAGFLLLRVRSRNSVRVYDDGRVLVLVSGRRVNSTDDVRFLLPKDPSPWPGAVYCVADGKTTRLRLLSQNTYWTPPSLKRFASRLTELGLNWEQS